jgi:hypothetical protein
MDTVVRSRVTAVTIGGLVAILVAVGVILALREPPDAEPGTPEATTQGYFRAVSEHDFIGVETYLTEEVVERCEGMFHSYEDIGTGLRVVIVDTAIRDSRATVTVSVTHTYDDSPFFPGSHTFDQVLSMERIGDRWLISRPPWPLYCREV